MYMYVYVHSFLLVLFQVSTLFLARWAAAAPTLSPLPTAIAARGWWEEGEGVMG